MPEDTIPEFYTGQTIFLTGGTGFLGKVRLLTSFIIANFSYMLQVILEKVLRSCPGIKRVYLLARGRKGKSAEQRIQDMFAGSVFDQLRAVQPSFHEKVSVVLGEMTEPRLGLSTEAYAELAEKYDLVQVRPPLTSIAASPL
jgi:fatty acyl-CoA reductase